LDPIEEISRSRYARRLLAARPELSAEASPDAAAFGRAEILAEHAAGSADDLAALQRRLRRLRQRVLLRVMARDLTGRAGLAEVCGTMSDLAECSLEAGLRFAQCEDLAVVGMGKLGGRELNVSSDIDLVFVHPGEVESRERYERAGRMLIRLLSETTEDGLAFRVDMRLRPYGDAGPLACNLEFLETYFITQGREWERYAWIKARSLTGTLAADLDKVVRPFVFRKYLDYATLGAMRRLHAEVRREVQRRELAGNVKLGPGGIREVEFVAQALQLIRGGRDAELTARPTLQVLSILPQRNLLPAQAAQELSQAYAFLRNVEHRLQYLDDAQRHDLPEEDEDRGLLAAMCGFPRWDAFFERLQQHRAAVTQHFQAVFAEDKQPAEAWPEHPRLDALRSSQRYAALPEDSRRRLDAVVPALARAAAATPAPRETIARGADLLEAIANRAAYLALLA
jgi:[glutamine synthetase] adenylyltransferase / [glutamine synthetase]-adenylyl-L-tyrosine phosphorylase